MLETIASAQVFVLALLLLMGTIAKIATARGAAEPGALARLGPAVLVGERWRAPAMYCCAAGELLLALGLIFTELPIFRWATIAFFSMATYVLLELRRRRPDVGCGCFGEVSARPIGLRSIGRTIALTGMAVAATWSPASVLSLLIPTPGLSWTLLATGVGGALLLLAALSPELEETIARLRYRAPCEQRPFPPAAGLARLRGTAAWRAHAPLLLSEQPTDIWRELCWRFFSFPGRTPDGEMVDVVFALYLSGRRPPVRVAMVTADGEPVTNLAESIPVSA
ncbi:hypothetical protein HNP84_000486 [Thermocatellispora tengchongensis]|uniref:Methylamine utilisation protein MauE domain-containing protein n=1 Tax=Thermocatellispora tengchongensis TaxID=1073253 RepID=A0A840NT93_9ACTN|nr:MauE/DoxX family redox-associated membrane protein [Thermocatellispora tengchongensis]MBB5130798.1 hypothetical protein [Thermocatellispora tengchongensis]